MLSRVFVSVMAVSFLLSMPASALEFTNAGGSLGVELRYENVVDQDMRNVDHIFPGVNNPLSVNSRLKTNRAMAGIFYRIPGGVILGAHGGMAVGGKLTGTSVDTFGSDGTISETWEFDAAPIYGLSMHVDLFPNSMFHIIPRLRWLHTNYQGTEGSVSNSGTSCTYTYTANGSTSCVTLNGIVEADGSISTHFTEDLFAAQLEFALDLFGGGGGGYGGGGASGLRLRAGAEQSVSTITGRVNHTVGASTPWSERWTFSTTRPQGVYAGISWLSDKFQLGAEAHALATTTYAGYLSWVF